jgi:hypothetical protein
VKRFQSHTCDVTDKQLDLHTEVIRFAEVDAEVAEIEFANRVGAAQIAL